MHCIDGAARIYAIVGDPIARARSPIIYNAKLRELGRNAALIPLHVQPPDFDCAMAGLMRTANVDGIIVTYPYKQRALELADEVGLRARQVDATNALRRIPDGRWFADMFDGIGCTRAIGAAGASPRDRRIWLIGAGGAGSAIAFALADAGATALSITDLDTARAGALAAKVAAAYPSCATNSEAPEPSDIGMLINATPTGLHDGDGMVVDTAMLRRDLAVVDIVPRQGDTPLLAQARKLGCTVVSGGEMVEGQVGAVLDFFWQRP